MVAGGKPWVIGQLNRSKQVPVLADVEVSVAAPEDVILGKLAYYRDGGSEKHLRDITGILKASAVLIDQHYIAQQACWLRVIDLWEAVLNLTRVE